MSMTRKCINLGRNPYQPKAPQGRVTHYRYTQLRDSIAELLFLYKVNTSFKTETIYCMVGLNTFNNSATRSVRAEWYNDLAPSLVK